jgi:hypothetical protein
MMIGIDYYFLLCSVTLINLLHVVVVNGTILRGTISFSLSLLL